MHKQALWTSGILGVSFHDFAVCNGCGDFPKSKPTLTSFLAGVVRDAVIVVGNRCSDKLGEVRHRVHGVYTIA